MQKITQRSFGYHPLGETRARASTRNSRQPPPQLARIGHRGLAREALADVGGGAAVDKSLPRERRNTFERWIVGARGKGVNGVGREPIQRRKD